jgi:hypothetical protein
MKLNAKIHLHGQKYVCVGHRHHETRDGRWLDMLELESDCPDCGITFRLLATKSNAHRRTLTRRCTDCRRPGVPVEPRRRHRTMAGKPAKSKKVVSGQTCRRQSPKTLRGAPHSNLAAEAAAAAPDAPAPSAMAIDAQAEARETYMRALSMLDG